MRSITYILVFLIAVVQLKAQIITYTVQPDDHGIDATITRTASSTNYSATPTLRASRSVTSSFERALLKFDLSALTPGVEIGSAKLILSGTNHQGTSVGNGVLQMVPDKWSESLVTWGNATLLKTSDMPTVGLTSPTSSTQNYTLDVTAMVQSMVNTPNVNFGWLLSMALEDNSSNRSFEFASSDNSTAALRPQLIVTYAQPLVVNSFVSPSEKDTSHNAGVFVQVSGGASPFTYVWGSGGTTQDIYNISPGVQQITVTDVRGVKSVQLVPVTSGCGNVTYTLNYTDPKSFTDVVLLQESFNGNTASRNFATSPGITAYNKTTSSGNSVARSLLSFNLNSLPANATINSATLKLTDNEGTYSSSFKVQLCRVSQSWKETTVAYTTQPTYNDSVGDVIEFDYDGSLPVYSIDVTQHLQKMVSQGNTTNGWLLKLKTETSSSAGSSVTFIGADNGTGNKPVMVVQVSLPDGTCDDYTLNWHQEDVYDETGAIIGSEKTYRDNLGRQTQHLTKNALSDVFTSQVVYDSYGRPALSSMSAYSGTQLLYRPGFMRNLNGQPYQYTNFDLSTTLNNPDAIQNGMANTLGSYYSNNNPYDAYQAIADNPYTRVEYQSEPGGDVKAISKPGNAFKKGNKRENYSFIMSSGDELTGVYGSSLSYKAKENSANPLDCVPFSGFDPIAATKQVVITPDNREMITYSVGDKVLASCYSGLANGDACSYAVSNRLYYSGTQSTDIHLPDAYKGSLVLALPTQQGDVSPMPSNKISFKITDLYRDVVLVEGTNYAVNPTTRVVTFDNSTFLNMYTGRGLVLRISFSYDPVYEAGLTAPVDVVINYMVDYGRFNKNFYDLSGALLKSVSPKGFSCSTPNPVTMATTYNYNRKGQAIAKKSPDEGLVELKYDEEGKLRFTQNAVQNTGNRFSYVNYDKHGRIYETGEYQSTNTAGSVWFNTQAGPNSFVYVDALVNKQDGLPAADKSFITSASYTAPAAGGTDDLPTAYGSYSQYRNFRNGQLNCIKNQNKTVWYNYDQVDRPLANITQVTEADFVAKNPGINNQVKTSQSSYNYFTGLNSSATYQLNNSNEKLLYQFTYDANLRPSTNSITYGSITQTLSANSYNKSGGLKRVVTGNNLQGTDFVYTLNGGLKAINHPALDPTLDPGRDNGDYVATTGNVNKDLFGEIIDYYFDDYNRNNTYISSSIASMSSKYNNLIYANRFKTRGTVGSVQSRANFVAYGTANQDSILTGSVYGQKEFRFAYAYDEFNQLASSVFGTYNNSTNVFTSYNGYAEQGASGGTIGYDKNGNLTRLVRQAYRNVSSNTPILADDLTYTNASSSNQLTAIVDAAPTTNGFTAIENFETPSQVSPSAFTYNSNGQLTQSLAEDVSAITYFPNGKIKMITYNSTGNTTEYEYGPQGEKLKSKYHIISGNKYKYTWYVGPYIYEYDEQDPVPAFKIAEVKTPGGAIRVSSSTNVGTGYLVYYVTDHLGNVRATYKASGTGNGLTLLGRDDYYAFGGRMLGRSWSSENTRYAYQGQEKATDGNPWDQFELRMYNHDLGRWFAPDPYGQFDSPYIGMGNNPVSNTDPDGGQVDYAPEGPRGRFLGKEQDQFERDNGLGAYAPDQKQKRYRNEVDDLVQHKDPYNPGAFLDALYELNNQYYGLSVQMGQQVSFDSGLGYLLQSELTTVPEKAFRNQSTVSAMNGHPELQPVFEDPTAKVLNSQNEAKEKELALYVTSTEKYAVGTKGRGQSDEEGHQDGIKVVTNFSDGSSSTICYNMDGEVTYQGETPASVYYYGEGDENSSSGGDPKKPQGSGSGNVNADGGSLPDMKKNPPDHPEYESPKGGDRKVKNPNGKGSGWLDNKGRVWVPTDHNGTHAPHYDRQKPGGGYDNVYPFGITGEQLIQGGLILGGAAIILFDILTIPSGEGLIGVEMIRRAVAP